MLRSSLRPAAICAIAGLAGCATIVEGSTQALEIRSQPDGAECALTREGVPIGKVTTPGTITVKRSANAIVVTCAKEGFEEARGVMNAQINSTTYGNVIFGGFIGHAIDNSSGANRRYEPLLSLTLSPMSAADIAAAAARRKAAAPTPVAVTSPSAPALMPRSTAAGAWKADTVVITEKAGSTTCTRGGATYSFNLANDQLTVDNAAYGRMFTAPLPTDGSIDQKFISPSGANLKIVGNARSRELELVNTKSGCRWTLVPDTSGRTEMECAGDDGTRLRVTASACPSPLKRVQ
jgi:hypothetical protein